MSLHRTESPSSLWWQLSAVIRRGLSWQCAETKNQRDNWALKHVRSGHCNGPGQHTGASLLLRFPGRLGYDLQFVTQ